MCDQYRASSGIAPEPVEDAPGVRELVQEGVPVAALNQAHVAIAQEPRDRMERQAGAEGMRRVGVPGACGSTTTSAVRPAA
jgi:hypothetical protein